jgi:hypothetical protein
VVALLAPATSSNVANGPFDVGLCHNSASNFGTRLDRNLAQQRRRDQLKIWASISGYSAWKARFFASTSSA